MLAVSAPSWLKYPKDTGGGDEGGTIVAAGTPDEVKNAPTSVTAKFI